MKKHATLFSGVGGPDLAAEWMGWTNVFSCEIEDRAHAPAGAALDTFR